MHTICLQENLKQALSVTERIIGKNLTLPILNNILLSAEGNKLKVSSTNLEIGINHWMVGKIEAKGSITVPARLIGDFVNNLPNKKVELKAKNNNLELKCEKFKATLRGLNAGDFPIIPKIENKPVMEIGANALKNGLAQVVGMVALSETRPGISGVYMKIDKNQVQLAATDSFRLAEKIIKVEGESLLDKSAKDKAVIIPQRTSQELIRILGEKSDGSDKFAKGGSSSSEEAVKKVKIIFSGNQILFDLGSTHIISRLIEDQYPDYQQVIPSNLASQIVVNRQELINNIKIASLFSGKINDVKLSISAKKSRIEISAKDADVGENKSQLGANVKGKDVEAAFNYRYILDGLNNIYSDKVAIGFDTVNKAVIKPMGDSSYTYVIMPIRA